MKFEIELQGEIYTGTYSVSHKGMQIDSASFTDEEGEEHPLNLSGTLAGMIKDQVKEEYADDIEGQSAVSIAEYKYGLAEQRWEARAGKW